MNKFELGDELKCKVTGFKGIAIERTEFLNGCVQYLLCPKVSKDGKYPDAVGIDVAQLELVKKKKTKITKKDVGGRTIIKSFYK